MLAAHATHATDETQLALALRGRDAGAAREAFRLYGPLVRGYLRRCAGTTDDGQDLSQEVFLRFFRRIDELRDPAALRGFLYSICLGVARNEHRRARVRRWVRLTSTGELPDVPAIGVDPEAREAAARFQSLLERASGEDRALFLTRHVDEMEIADIAHTHGLSFGTAKRRVARATRRLGARMTRDPLLADLWTRREPPARRPRPLPAAGASRRSSILEA